MSWIQVTRSIFRYVCMSWFISAAENSEGPYSTEDVKSFVDNGKIPLDSLIWGRGMDKWVTLTHWVKGNYASRTQQAPTQPMWHYAREGVSKGPMPRAELVLELSNIREKDLILVWTKGMKAWADLFEFPDLVEDLGLNRREHPRAPIKGSVMLRTETGATLCQLRTVSAGGIGVSGAPKELKMGDLIQLDISAAELGETIAVKAKVQYTTELGYIGLKFEGISQEAKSKILEYINSTKKNKSTDEDKVEKKAA